MLQHLLVLEAGRLVVLHRRMQRRHPLESQVEGAPVADLHLEVVAGRLTGEEEQYIPIHVNLLVSSHPRDAGQCSLTPML